MMEVSARRLGFASDNDLNPVLGARGISVVEKRGDDFSDKLTDYLGEERAESVDGK